MSDTSEYVPKVGDEVEVVLRGKVALATGGFWVESHRTGAFIDSTQKHVVSVTRVRKPLPTEPGYAVEITSGNNLDVWALLTPDGWRDNFGRALAPDWLAGQDWRIVSVPVQEAW